VSNSTRQSSTETSSSGTGYDERFVVPLEASRRGAHRARVSPVMAVLPVAAVVGVVVGAIALVYLFLGGMNGSDSGDTTTAAAPASASASSSGAAGANGASPSAGGSVNASATDTVPSTSAVGTVDRALPVAVYNGTSPVVSGLARKAAGRLTGAGWRLGTVDTWRGTAVDVTTVYFGTPDQRTTALAVIKSLGHGVAKLSSAKAGAGIAVVVGNDYPTGGILPTQPRVTSTAHRAVTGPSATVTAGGRTAIGHASLSSTAPAPATKKAVVSRTTSAPVSTSPTE
jgi:hypothetical protein